MSASDYGRVHVGNATVDGSSTKGWFIGNYVDPNLVKTGDLEVAWSPSKAGDHRDTWVVNQTASFLTILFQGREIVETPNGEHDLSTPGDYIYGGPGVPQRFRIMEDNTLTVTVKWPSLPDDILRFETLEQWRASLNSPQP